MHAIGNRATEELYKIVEGWTPSQVILLYNKLVGATWAVESILAEDGLRFILTCRSATLDDKEYDIIRGA